MEIVTKQYLENNLIAYDNYRGLGKIGQANGIATLDANGTLSSAQVPSNVVTTSSTSLMTAAEKTKLAGISDGATSTEVTEGDIESTDPNAYVVGTIKVDDAIIDLYGKDTTYQVATISEAGLVKIGNNNRATGTLKEEYGWHPVQLNNDNQAYVHVSSDAELWRKLYPDSFFVIKPVNSDNDSFYGCTVNFPNIVNFAKLSYCPYNQINDQTFAHLGKYSNNKAFALTIAEDKKVFHKSYITYLFLDVITNKGHFDLVLQISPTDLTKQSFNATII